MTSPSRQKNRIFQPGSYRCCSCCSAAPKIWLIIRACCSATPIISVFITYWKIVAQMNKFCTYKNPEKIFSEMWARKYSDFNSKNLKIFCLYLSKNLYIGIQQSILRESINPKVSINPKNSINPKDSINSVLTGISSQLWPRY